MAPSFSLLLFHLLSVQCGQLRSQPLPTPGALPTPKSQGQPGVNAPNGLKPYPLRKLAAFLLTHALESMSKRILLFHFLLLTNSAIEYLNIHYG